MSSDNKQQQRNKTFLQDLCPVVAGIFVVNILFLCIQVLQYSVPSLFIYFGWATCLTGRMFSLGNTAWASSDVNH